MGIDWTLAWQITAVAFGFTFFVLIFLPIVLKISSFIIPRLPGGDEPEEKPTNNNATAGE